MNPSLHDGAATAQPQPKPQEPVIVQLDPKCLHSALKEFFDPLRSNDPRADFFAVYRKESDEFDRGYAKKYDEDLNTSLIFAGLFSAVSSAFIVDVQSKLEPDPNELTAAYMRVLIHAVNDSLFPDADPSTTTWAGPPSGIVTVQSLLYASLATSLFASFLAMLGKQWINRYLRNRGGSAADKSRNRQRKLDGFEKWHFHFVIESLPVMLQFALLLLGCALSLHLWTISRAVAGIIVAATLFGVAIYVFFTLAAIVSYNCPFHTPLSLITRVLIKHLSRNHTPRTRTRSQRPLDIPLVGFSRRSVKNLKKSLQRLRSGILGALGGLGYTASVPRGMVDVPFASVTPPPRIFDDMLIDWEVCKADIHCVAWVLDSTTDSDMILSTVRFAADMVWYPEVAEVLSPHILADLFFECFLDDQVIPGKLEYASSLGMTLASVLSTKFIMDPEREDLKEICDRITHHLSPYQGESMFAVVIAVLLWVARVPNLLHGEALRTGGIGYAIPDNLPVMFKVWLSRLMLQTLWRWKRCQGGAILVVDFYDMGLLSGRLMVDGAPVPNIFKTNIILILVVCLGLTVGMRDLYIPNTDSVRYIPSGLLEGCLWNAVRVADAPSDFLRFIFSVLDLLYPTQFLITSAISWMGEVLDSGYEEAARYQIAGHLMELLRNRLDSPPPEGFPEVDPGSVPHLLGFLRLSERYHGDMHWSYPGATALRLLSDGVSGTSRYEVIVPVISAALLPTHPLQSRVFALKIFQRCGTEWFSPKFDSFSTVDRVTLLKAVGDPFDFLPATPSDAERFGYEPMTAAVLLIKLLATDLWRDHLQYTNFSTCESITSTEQGRELALTCIRELEEFLNSPTDVIAVTRRLKGLGCWNTAETILLWAWTTDTIDPAIHDDWRLIGKETLEFYRVHGMWRLHILALYIKNNISWPWSRWGFYGVSSCRVRGVRWPVRVMDGLGEDWERTGRVSVACRLRGLYQLFGCDSTTWGEMLRGGCDADVAQPPGSRFKIGGGSVTDGHVRVKFPDFVCDYP